MVLRRRGGVCGDRYHGGLGGGLHRAHGRVRGTLPGTRPRGCHIRAAHDGHVGDVGRRNDDWGRPLPLALRDGCIPAVWCAPAAGL